MSSIRVELRSVPDGGSEYTAVADLVVHEDGQYELNDPEGHLLLEIPVPVPSEDNGLRRVFFAEEPQLWARNLHRALRTGYLVPVVQELTDPRSGDARDGSAE